MSPAENVNNQNAKLPGATQSPGAYAHIYNHSVAQLEPAAPPFLFSAHAGVDEIATDNVAETATNRQADLASLFSLGADMSADSTRFDGIVSATGVYRRNIEDTSLNEFSGYGYANGRAQVIPGYLYISLHGDMDDVSRLGGGQANALVQTAQETQAYTVAGSAYLTTGLGDIGRNVLRAQVGQVWFNRNTGSLDAFGFDIGPISSAQNASAREDFKMAGTILARLMSDINLGFSQNDSGVFGSGKFTRLNAGVLNEYELTRYASLIGDAGFEHLTDDPYSYIDGSDIFWGAGVRLRPNADLHILVSYGRHDSNGFRGRSRWRFTDQRVCTPVIRIRSVACRKP